MVRPFRVSTTLAVVCVFACQLSTATLFAAEQQERAPDSSVRLIPTPAPSLDLASQARRALPVPSRPFLAAEFAVSNPQVYRGAPYPYPYHDRDASMAALLIGAAATITGTALLVYANRPECSSNPVPGGCGYGMKVVGASVLSGGIVGLFVGALTWR